MSKEFTVLAECVDARSGNRFKKDAIFTPPPSAEQAKRLVAARCLPDEAIAAAEKLENESAGKAARRDKAIEKAQGVLDNAKAALVEADKALEAAADAEKPKASEARDAAKKAVDDAEAALVKAQQV